MSKAKKTNPKPAKKHKSRFGLTKEAEARLSKSFSNSSDCFKVVDDGVFGYIVMGGGSRAAPKIIRLHRADIFMKVPRKQKGKLVTITHLISSYEWGIALNEESFNTDFEGCALADIAVRAIGALEARAPKSRRG